MSELAPRMPVAATARILGEHDRRIWGVGERCVEAARAGMDLSAVTRAGWMRLPRGAGRAVRPCSPTSTSVGRSSPRQAATRPGVERSAADLAAHGGDAGQAAGVCAGLSPAFVCGAAEHLAEAEVAFGRCQAIQALSTAAADVRKAERRMRPELARSRYVRLERPRTSPSGRPSRWRG